MFDANSRVAEVKKNVIIIMYKNHGGCNYDWNQVQGGG
jgi:hypothetical protein